MIGITTLIGLFFSFLSLMTRPGFSLGLLIMVLLVWPEYLRIPLGIMQMSAPRLVAVFLLIKFLINGRQRSMTFGRVDTYIGILWLWIIFANILAGAEFSEITSKIGYGFDTVLMYMVARLAIQEKRDLKDLALPLALTALLMCVAGVVETTTSYSPYRGLDSFRPWQWFVKTDEFRLGFLRAKASTSVHIYFGMSMMMITGILWSLRSDKRIRTLCKYAALLAALAALSSMSSGPWLALIILVVCNAYIFKPALIKPTLIPFGFLAVFLELASNRHFYNLIDYLALSSHTAWYRTRLLEVAANQWHEFWLVGVGGNWPHHWGALLDSRLHIDVVNHFLIVGLYGGFPAMILYVAAHLRALKQIRRCRTQSKDEAQRVIIFGLGATLVALDVSSMSVGLFGPPLLLSNILLGLLISVSSPWREDAKEIQR
ncbi:MAG: hypothetical protein JKY04_04205 [Sneathiella sp.]|nr:hypothetical protein [Sneathiella sp.]